MNKHRDGDKLTATEEQCFRNGHCPDCGSPLRLGPTGGLSVNYLCSGSVKGGGESHFNDMGLFGVERIRAESTCAKVRVVRRESYNFFAQLKRLESWIRERM